MNYFVQDINCPVILPLIFEYGVSPDALCRWPGSGLLGRLPSRHVPHLNGLERQTEGRPEIIKIILSSRKFSN